MYTTDAFEFTAAAPDRVDVVVDQSVLGKQGLLDRFAQDLSFPDYFGRNWDALIDCLSDLSWVQAPEVVIDHAAVPQLLSSDLMGAQSGSNPRGGLRPRVAAEGGGHRVPS
jgi:hypothetical protein